MHLTFLTFLACTGPTTTGGVGIVGTVVDSGGIPVRDLRVESMEHGERTDKNGRFAVSWKDDKTVRFAVDGTYFRRVFLDEDEGKEVRIALPRLAESHLDCRLPNACQADLSWDLGDGLFGRASVLCTPGGRVPLSGVPTGVPTAVCETGIGQVPLPVELMVEGRGLVLRAPPTPLRIEVRSEEPLPGCVVMVGGVMARPSGAGFWVAQSRGNKTVTALCDGRWAVPVTVPAGTEGVVLNWLSDGPTLDVPALVTFNELTLVRQGGTGWLLKVQRRDGRFMLPLLADGVYSFRFGSPGFELAAPKVDDVVALKRHSGGVSGTLRVTADIADGPLVFSGP